MKQFPQMLYELRVSILELTQQHFARRLGVSPQYICDLESGRRMPSVKFVKTLCTYLHQNSGTQRARSVKWHRAAAIAHGFEIEEETP